MVEHGGTNDPAVMTNGNDGCGRPTKTLLTGRSTGVLAPGNSPCGLVADVTDYSAQAPRREKGPDDIQT
jgi:hypothetical protein